MKVRVAMVALAVSVFAFMGATAVPSQSAKPKPKPLCLGKRATIVGTARANRITGTARNDVIAGLGGADVINGAGGTDRVCGGAGFDTCRNAERRSSCEETRPVIVVGSLSAGEYLGDPFRPKLSLTLGPGWSIENAVRPIDFLLEQKDDPQGRFILFDSFGSGTGVADTIARRRGIEGLRFDPTEGASIGGRAGQRADALTTASDIVVVPSLGARYELEPNDRARFYAIDVGGTTVTIIIEAPAAEWDAFLPVAEAVLASVRWGG